ncbi:hypothetical protein HanRHA438_Chr05g0246571 [Helianthus annuus]|nr:hypothetical protein HanIR_Chr05g0255131 [Helianthus annuus]KAJ0920920.1 hypothetical protein HanRHA438_Chr05g0246571 [Helianthus annuus]
MANSGEGDKFRSPIIPNCCRTASQEANLQSCPFATRSKVSLNDNQPSSSTATGITLPESSDEYHTPPEHHSSSQNSTNDAHPPPPNTSAVDQDPIPVENGGVETELTSTHQVFDKMPQREQQTSNREKRRLPVSMKIQKQNSICCKRETFTSSLNRVLKMVQNRGGGDEDDNVDFVETAKMRGLTFPGPRWWPPQGFKD